MSGRLMIKIMTELDYGGCGLQIIFYSISESYKSWLGKPTKGKAAACFCLFLTPLLQLPTHLPCVMLMTHGMQTNPPLLGWGTFISGSKCADKFGCPLCITIWFSGVCLRIQQRQAARSGNSNWPTMWGEGYWFGFGRTFRPGLCD